MYKWLLASAFLFLGSILALAEDTKVNLTDKLMEVSVTVKGAGGTGSGVVFVVNDGRCLVWTAAHVVDDLRVPPDEGDKNAKATFKDANVIKPIIEDGRLVGRTEVSAKILKYSDAEKGQDLAILLIRKKKYSDIKVDFYDDKKLPKLGTELIHIGSPFGEFGSSSYISGEISQFGRLIDDKIFDQCSINAQRGCSGGGVFIKQTGQLYGLLTRGAPGGFTLVVPSRRIKTWAKQAKVEWAVNRDIEMPKDTELDKLPIE